MRYYRLTDDAGESRLAAESKDGLLSDLTSVDDGISKIEDLAYVSSLSGLTIDNLTQTILHSGNADTYDLTQIYEDSRNATGELWVDRPFDPPEVWAAGVTYKTSQMERRRESNTPDVYSKVYIADRPEIFFKSTADRCMGPFETIGVRADSEWNVPEPELAFVIYRNEIVGYTIGNDVSSRSIEGENPLYLPQAKMYDNSCAIGPCFVTTETLSNPQSLTIECSIYRQGDELFQGKTSTSGMNRSCDDLCDWLQRHNTVPNMTTVLTGTAIVPPPEISLSEGDVVRIMIENIGLLENPVSAV